MRPGQNAYQPVRLFGPDDDSSEDLDGDSVVVVEPTTEIGVARLPQTSDEVVDNDDVPAIPNIVVPANAKSG